MIVDSSALLAVLLREPDAARYEAAIAIISKGMAGVRYFAKIPN